MISIKELEKIIADKSLTTPALANLIGVEEESMLSLFRSKNPIINNVEEIARRLDIPVGRLFGDVNQTSGGDSYNAQGEATVSGGSNNSASLINVQGAENESNISKKLQDIKKEQGVLKKMISDLSAQKNERIEKLKLPIKNLPKWVY
jgi:DNA-binding Xre family transcriptional regulator